MVKFDWTINIGTIITSVLLLVGTFRLYARINEVAFQVDTMWKWFKKEHHID